jgi:hypothetical protein
MTWPGQDFTRLSDLHQMAVIHNAHTIREFRHQREIMAYEQQSQAMTLFQSSEKLEELGLNGWVERAGGFVRYEQPRAVTDRQGKTDALAHST